MDETSFCLHGHFYQPPRGVLFDSGTVPEEPEAAPFRNWNEKIAAECYTPNANLGNFGLISFDLGVTLSQWFEHNLPETHQKILQAYHDYTAAHGTGNALAQSAHHTVLPLALDRDKETQVYWGLARFQHRYGRPSAGLWLPEMAVDLSTLQKLAGAGVRFTILSQAQVKEGEALPGAGPYWVELPDGARIAAYVRDDRLSLQLAYNAPELGGAGRWSREVLLPHRKRGHRLTLVGVDGETFGHHHKGEEHFLHWLLKYEAGAAGYLVTTLALDLQDHSPGERIEIRENSAWSCSHGLARWSEGCPCTPGDPNWKRPLRKAMDVLAEAVDGLYDEVAWSAGADPQRLRNDYVRVTLGQAASDFLADHALGGLSTQRAESLLKLLRAQAHRQSMFVSSAFAGDDLDRPESRYAIANALAAADLACQATSVDLAPEFSQWLALSVSSRTGRTGKDLLEEARELLQ